MWIIFSLANGIAWWNGGGGGGGGGRASSMKFASKDRAIEVYRQSSIAIHIHESERESLWVSLEWMIQTNGFLFQMYDQNFNGQTDNMHPFSNEVPNLINSK